MSTTARISINASRRRRSSPAALFGGRGMRMRSETVSIHGGFDLRPCDTHAVAVPIYQNVAYEFDSADQAAAMFDLEIPGFPIQPHLQSDRGCSGEARGYVGGRRRLPRYRFRPGCVGLRTAQRRRRRRLDRRAAAALRHDAYAACAYVEAPRRIEARFAKSDRPEDIAALIDDTTRAVFSRDGRQPRRQYLRH